MARVIESMLIIEHDKIEVVEGEKIDAADLIAMDKLTADTRESLISEVEAGYEMYRDSIAKRLYNRSVEELTPEEVVALDEAIPFKFSRQNE